MMEALLNVPLINCYKKKLRFHNVTNNSPPTSVLRFYFFSFINSLQKELITPSELKGLKGWPFLSLVLNCELTLRGGWIVKTPVKCEDLVTHTKSKLVF